MTVKRPEGVVLTVLAGPPVRPRGAVDSAAKTLNEKKDAALRDGDPDRLHALEDHERDDLAKRLAPAKDEAPVSSVEHATRLNRLLLDAADEAEGDAARHALYKELLAREIPLLLIVDPKTQAAALRELPGGIRGMAAYPDRASLLAAADDLGLSPGTFGAAEMVPEKLFGWAASNGHAVLVNVYRTRGEPLYVPIALEIVRTLAQGQAPPREQKK
ncbi:Hypothetical protein A7982_05946 [Minicystis rosea]|nr:Hypothetical protein A7982_05946 [Minicystis rosea]